MFGVLPGMIKIWIKIYLEVDTGQKCCTQQKLKMQMSNAVLTVHDVS